LSTSEVVDIIKKKFDVDYSLSGATNLLHRLGFSYKKAKAITGKAKKKSRNSSFSNITDSSKRERSTSLTQLIRSKTPSSATDGLRRARTSKS
jgi:Winged helix-turn helix